MKRCKTCQEAKPESEFHRHSGNRLRSECKVCRAKTKRREYLRDREKILARQKELRDADPETFYAKRREYNRRNAERKRAYEREYRKSHREQRNAPVRAWHKANRERSRQLKRKSQAKRRAQKLALPCEDVDPLLVFERDQGVCGICGESVDPANWHLDHIIPLARGGSHTYANVQTAHPACNIRKGAGER